jgi:hypothetical protein
VPDDELVAATPTAVVDAVAWGRLPGSAQPSQPSPLA